MDVNLLLVKKDGSFKTIPMPSRVTVLGRRRDCDLRIPINSVSRRHYQLHNNGSAISIRDLDSTNGTIVNGQAVTESSINPGDKISLGNLNLIMQIDGKPEKLEINDSHDDVSDEMFAEFTDIEPDEKLTEN